MLSDVLLCGIELWCIGTIQEYLKPEPFYAGLRDLTLVDTCVVTEDEDSRIVRLIEPDQLLFELLKVLAKRLRLVGAPFTLQQDQAMLRDGDDGLNALLPVRMHNEGLASRPCPAVLLD